MADAEHGAEAIRGRILEAAAYEFAEKGYTGSRVDGIARRAGVNKALLYYHLGDKATIYGEVILANLRGAENALREGLGRTAGPEEKFRVVVRTMARMIADSPYLPRLILREAAFGGVNIPDPVLKGIGRIFALIRSVLKEGEEEGSFRPADPLLTHFMIAGSIMFLSVSTPLRRRLADIENLDARAAETPEEIAAHITDVLLHGLLKAGPAVERSGGKGGR